MKSFLQTAGLLIVMIALPLSAADTLTTASGRRVSIEYYRQNSDRIPVKTVTLTKKETIDRIVALHGTLPSKGTLFLKLSPYLPLYRVRVTEGDKTILMFTIYKNSVQYENSAFSEKNSPGEDALVRLVKSLLE